MLALVGSVRFSSLFSHRHGNIRTTHPCSNINLNKQSYKEHEALVFHQLTNLIKDTVWLKSYVSAVLRVESEAFSVANVALGSMKAALPSSVSRSEDVDPIQMSGMIDSLSNDGIPAARSDGMSRLNYKSRDSGLHSSPAKRNGNKDSMYTIEASSEGRDMRGDIPAFTNSGEYARPPVSAW